MWYVGWKEETNSAYKIGYATSLNGFTGLSVISDPTVIPGTGTVTIAAEFSGDTAGLALFADVEDNNATTLDSLELFDDGLHSDGAANDSIFANILTAPAAEATYNVGLKAVHDGAVVIDYDDFDRFTTVGPLKIEEFYFTGTDTIPHSGDTNIKLKVVLGNHGSSGSATAITATIIALDTIGVVQSIVDPDYGTIEAGGNSTITGYYRLRFNELTGDSDVTSSFKLDIYSDGYLFWSDTLSLEIFLGIDSELSLFPNEYKLHQNYPNPFNPITTLRYQIPHASEVRIVIYDILGQHVITLVDEQQQAGFKAVIWDSRNKAGQNVSVGMYFYRLEAENYIRTRKMILLK